MSQGLQCWDASGKLILDVTDRLTRLLGVIIPVSQRQFYIKPDTILTYNFLVIDVSSLALKTY